MTSDASEWFVWDDEDLVVRLRVSPKASRIVFTGIRGDRIGLSTTAAPVDGKANESVVRFVAKSFGVPRSRVALVNGARGRNKSLRISRPTKFPAELADLLSARARG